MEKSGLLPVTQGTSQTLQSAAHMALAQFLLKSEFATVRDCFRSLCMQVSSLTAAAACILAFKQYNPNKQWQHNDYELKLLQLSPYDQLEFAFVFKV